MEFSFAGREHRVVNFHVGVNIGGFVHVVDRDGHGLAGRVAAGVRVGDGDHHRSAVLLEVEARAGLQRQPQAVLGDRA